LAFGRFSELAASEPEVEEAADEDEAEGVQGEIAEVKGVEDSIAGLENETEVTDEGDGEQG
jgi:hypothetical protein